MTASLLIGLIALTDLLRARRGHRPVWPYLAGLWVAFVAFATFGLAVNAVTSVAVVAVATAWVILMPATDADVPRRLWPVLGFVVLVLATAVSGDAWMPPGIGQPSIAAEAYRGAGGILQEVSLQSLIAGVGVVLFLMTSSNIITRAALGRAAVPVTPVGERHRAWEVRIRGRVVGEVGEARRVPAATSFLQGGRLIGPIERVLIVILALLGAYVLIAALVAAKGVVRFPEISADRGVGSKAEEFLVGSLTSWSIAAAAGLYLAAVIR